MRIFSARLATRCGICCLSLIGLMRAPTSGYEFCATAAIQSFCDDSDGLRARIESGAGFESRGNFDCISVAKDGSIFVHRYIASIRRVRLAQVLVPPGHETPAWTGLWERSGRIDVLWADSAEAGVAVDDSDKRVYLAGASPNEILVFDRDPDTGLLNLNGVRGFWAEAARAEYLEDIRRKASRERSVR